MATKRKTDLKSVEQEVASLLDRETSAIELSKKLFGPEGVFTRLGTTRRRREELVKRPVYRQAQARLTELQRQEAARFEAAAQWATSRRPKFGVQPSGCSETSKAFGGL